MPLSICYKRYKGSWEGFFCTLFVLICWLYSTYCVMFVIVIHFVEENYQPILFYGYFVLSMCTLTTQYQAITSSPGIVHPVSQSTAETFNWPWCGICEKYKVPRSHHCTRCGICIRKMDHHCIWINNCVGENNIGLFVRFLLYACWQSFLTLILCVMYYLPLFPDCVDCLLIRENQRGIVRLQIFGVFIISIWLFGFTFTLFINRMLLIAADLTTIEMLQHGRSWLRYRLRNPDNPGAMKLLARVFGGESMVFWFLPLTSINIVPCYDQMKFEPDVFTL